MIAQAMTGTPGHVNTMATAVAHFFKHFPQTTMKPGDVFITNDPWLGTGHLFDYVMMTPVFLGKKSSPSSPPPATSSTSAAWACRPRPTPPSRRTLIPHLQDPQGRQAQRGTALHHPRQFAEPGGSAGRHPVSHQRQ